jgi:16S rRNA (guanine527-N7)-methyltransferase
MELRLEIFGRELFRWRRTTNLVSEQSHSDLWLRHIQDSLQIVQLAPKAKRWLDIGTGAGFPGLIIAIQLHGVVDATVHCVESDKRKCAFLAHIVRELEIPAIIHPVRIEDIESESILPIDAVTSRAVASLPQLLVLSQLYLDKGAVGIFPQGRNYTDAVEFLRAKPNYTMNIAKSTTDPDSRIICLRNRTVCL